MVGKEVRAGGKAMDKGKARQGKWRGKARQDKAKPKARRWWLGRAEGGDSGDRGEHGQQGQAETEAKAEAEAEAEAEAARLCDATNPGPDGGARRRSEGVRTEEWINGWMDGWMDGWMGGGGGEERPTPALSPKLGVRAKPSCTIRSCGLAHAHPLPRGPRSTPPSSPSSSSSSSSSSSVILLLFLVCELST